MIAALEFIITSAARNGVSHTDLQSELSQLGLPAEHSKLLCSLYQAQATELEINLTAQSLRSKYLKEFLNNFMILFKFPLLLIMNYCFVTVNQLSSVKVLPTEEKSPVAKLALKIKSLNDDEENVTINLVKDDIPVLLEGKIVNSHLYFRSAFMF